MLYKLFHKVIIGLFFICLFLLLGKVIVPNIEFYFLYYTDYIATYLAEFFLNSHALAMEGNIGDGSILPDQSMVADTMVGPFGVSLEGHYTINDPSNIGMRGYINPQTGMPYHSCQPFAKNLSLAMNHEISSLKFKGTSNSCTWNPDKYDANASKFYQEYLQYNYPSRSSNNY